jgi:hypothetical protein
MAYGPLNFLTITTADLVAPGMPVFVDANQVDNSLISLKLAMPVMDVDGGSLSGLVKLTVVSLPAAGGSNPFEGKTMVECLALPGVQKVDVALTVSDAGLEKSVSVAIMNLGGMQAFAAACSD